MQLFSLGIKMKYTIYKFSVVVVLGVSSVRLTHADILSDTTNNILSVTLVSLPLSPPDLSLTFPQPVQLLLLQEYSEACKQ